MPPRKPRDTEHGRKVGRVQVRVGMRTVTEDLRLDGKGVFYACHQGNWVSAPTQGQLEALLVEVVKAASTLTWTRIIRIDYESIENKGSHRYHPSLGQDVQSDRVDGFSISWRVFDVSSSHRRPETTERRRYSRGVEDGDDQHQVWRELEWREARPYDDDYDREDEQPAGWYPMRHENWDSVTEARPLAPNELEYTDERHAVLVQIRDQVRALDAKLRAFLGAEAGGVAARLDAVLDARRLLADGG